MSDLTLRDDDGKLRYWWSALAAVPRHKDSWAYRRLRRVWFDHTWSNVPFLAPGSELHMTAALFENFTILDAARWVPALLKTSGFPYTGSVEAANWGYEVLDATSNKLADVVINYRDEAGEGLVIIEAKRKGGRLKPSDCDPSSYLDLRTFDWTPRRQLIYLVDESDVADISACIVDDSQRSGILTWQSLAGLQISLALELPLIEELRSFVAGAIQQQFLAVDVIPAVLSAPYLSAEFPREQINAANPERMTTFERSTQEWRLTPKS